MKHLVFFGTLSVIGLISFYQAHKVWGANNEERARNIVKEALNVNQ